MKKLMMLAVLGLGLAMGMSACDKQKADAPAAKTANEPMKVPAASDSEGWKKYIGQSIKPYRKGITGTPYVYNLPSASVTEDFEELHGRQLEQVQGTLMSGIQPGTMIVFASPESSRMGELVIDAFEVAQPGTLKGVRVVFIGQPEEQALTKAAVEKSGAEFIFHHAK